ncbi:MAG TPA: hypothetical protein VHX16_19050 [Chloroflexota bacterium]|nr:hypothetical protein [Chloroflexota bacterium]
MNEREDERQLTTADIARGSTNTQTLGATPAPSTSAPAETRSEPSQAGPRPAEAANAQPRPQQPANQRSDGETAPLFAGSDAESFHSRWTDVQAGFVDDPRSSVEKADGLVADVIKNLADAFAEERAGLESQWQKGEDVSTEELRLALRRYRSFFDRLLAL